MPGVVKCKGCIAEGVTSVRPAAGPASRCATHQRARIKAARRRAHGLYVERTYGMPAEDYWALYDLQGGKCFVCRRATGASKHLAVDHDHACCPELPACGKCVRFLSCSPCNSLLAHLRDDKAALLRALVVLVWPPAQQKTRPRPPVMDDIYRLVLSLK